jgi:hypothetical protein
MRDIRVLQTRTRFIYIVPLENKLPYRILSAEIMRSSPNLKSELVVEIEYGEGVKGVGCDAENCEPVDRVSGGLEGGCSQARASRCR